MAVVKPRPAVAVICGHGTIGLLPVGIRKTADERPLGAIMRRWTRAWPLVAALLVLAGPGGCDAPSGVPPQKKAGSPSGPPPPQTPQTGTVLDSFGLAADEQPPAGLPAAPPPVAPPQTQPQATMPQPPITETPSPGSQTPAIRLSAGVALPQTGPEGTLMSFSVDYLFTGGQPDASGGYVWVIECARGKPMRVPVRLARKGNLPILVPGLRPEQGPFQSHMEDANGNRLSASISLR